MNQYDFWPDLTQDESTKCVFDLVKTLKEQLSKKYGGKIDCSLTEIEYSSSGIYGLNKSLMNISALVGPSEEKSPYEKDKKEIKANPTKEYKFLLVTEDYFSRLFDMEFGEFFPVRIKPTEGLTNGDQKGYMPIHSSDELNSVVLKYLQSQYVRDVIRYMLDIHH